MYYIFNTTILCLLLFILTIVRYNNNKRIGDFLDAKYIIALIIGFGIYASTMTALFKVYKPSIKAKKERKEKLKKERDQKVKARILLEEKGRMDKLGESEDLSPKNEDITSSEK